MFGNVVQYAENVFIFKISTGRQWLGQILELVLWYGEELCGQDLFKCLITSAYNKNNIMPYYYYSAFVDES